MPRPDGTIVIDTRLDGKGLDKGLAGLKRDATAGGLSIASALKTAALAAAAFAGVSILRSGWDRLTTIENAVKSLTVTLRDAAKAKKLMDAVLSVVKGTPYRLDDFAEAASNLVAFNVPAEKIPAILTAIADAAATTADPLAKAGQLVDTFGKVAAKGTLQMDDVWNISAAGIPVLQILGNAYEKNTDQMKEMISDGAVPAAAALDLLVAGAEAGTSGINGTTVALGGMAKTLGGSLSGTLANTGTAFSRLGARVIEPFEELIRAALDSVILFVDAVGEGMAPALEDASTDADSAAESLRSVADSIEAIGLAIGTVISLIEKNPLVFALKSLVMDAAETQLAWEASTGDKAAKEQWEAYQRSGLTFLKWKASVEGATDATETQTDAEKAAARAAWERAKAAAAAATGVDDQKKAVKELTEAEARLASLNAQDAYLNAKYALEKAIKEFGEGTLPVDLARAEVDVALQRMGEDADGLAGVIDTATGATVELGTTSTGVYEGIVSGATSAAGAVDTITAAAQGAASALGSVNDIDIQRSEQRTSRAPTGNKGGAEQWRSLVAKYFPADLVDKALHVIKYESGGRSNAIGDNGVAIGLFQIQDNTRFKGRPTKKQLLDPEFNIKYAAQVLGAAMGKWSDWGEGSSWKGKPFGALGNHPYGLDAGRTKGIDQLSDELDARRDAAEKLAAAIEEAQRRIASVLETAQRNMESAVDSALDEIERIKQGGRELALSIARSLGLFSEGFRDFQESMASGEVSRFTLFDDMQGSIAALETWRRELAILGKRGLPQDMLLELRAMGLDSADEVAAMTDMTAEELKRYVGLWRTRDKLGSAEAATQTREAIAAEVARLPGDLRAIGAEAMKGLGAGLASQSAGVSARLNSLVAKMIADLKHQLGIRSPSTLMEREVGLQMALGIGPGFDTGMRTVTASMRRSVSSEMARFATVVPAASGASGARGGISGVQVLQSNQFTIASDYDARRAGQIQAEQLNERLRGMGIVVNR